MATTAASSVHMTRPDSAPPGRRFDHLFFTCMAVAMLLTAFAGFARTYYLAGVFRAPLPSLIVHVHGAAFSCWILLLVTQTSLVSAGRTDIHRRLGVVGFLLGCLMLILGPLAATDSLVRNAGPAGRDARVFYIVPLTDMLLFAVFLFFAYRKRSDPASHKRLIYVATTGLLIAAIARLPFSFSYRKSPIDGALSYLFLIVLVSYDWWSTRRIHRVTVWASALLILVQQTRLPIGRTEVWRNFATWVQHLAR